MRNVPNEKIREMRCVRNESEKWESWAMRKKWAMEMKMWEMINEKCEKLQIRETGNENKWEQWEIRNMKNKKCEKWEL